MNHLRQSFQSLRNISELCKASYGHSISQPFSLSYLVVLPFVLTIFIDSNNCGTKQLKLMVFNKCHAVRTFYSEFWLRSDKDKLSNLGIQRAARSNNRKKKICRNETQWRAPNLFYSIRHPLQ